MICPQCGHDLGHPNCHYRLIPYAGCTKCNWEYMYNRLQPEVRRRGLLS